MFRLSVNTFAGVTVFTDHHLLNVLVHYINIQLLSWIRGEILFLIDVLLIQQLLSWKLPSVVRVPLLYLLNLFDRCCNLDLVYHSNYTSLLLCSGTRGGVVGWGTALQAGRLRFRFRPNFGTGVDPASTINEYQVYMLGDKGGWRVGLTTLPAVCADCLEIW